MFQPKHNIRYVSRTAGVLPHHLDGFFVGWADPPATDTHLRLLEESDEIVLVVDNGSRQAVGFVTAITDGVLSAYIPFLEVLPAYQGNGIGRELVRRILQRLTGFYMVDLVCDAHLEPFYVSLGMRPATAMTVRDREHQSGRAEPDEDRIA